VFGLLLVVVGVDDAGASVAGVEIRGCAAGVGGGAGRERTERYDGEEGTTIHGGSR
jgi:hypothetical protein